MPRPKFSIQDVFAAEQKRIESAAKSLAVQSNETASPEEISEALKLEAEATADVATKLADSNVMTAAANLNEQEVARLAAAEEAAAEAAAAEAEEEVAD